MDTDMKFIPGKRKGAVRLPKSVRTEHAASFSRSEQHWRYYCSLGIVVEENEETSQHNCYMWDINNKKMTNEFEIKIHLCKSHSSRTLPPFHQICCT